MKKSSLRTVKEKNRRLILRHCSPRAGSPGSNWQNRQDFLPAPSRRWWESCWQRAFVQESGLRAATAGRSRAGLTICPDYGRVVVVDIGRSHAVLYLYDMALQCVFRTVLPDHGGDGNELLTSISDAIFQGFSMEELHAGKMKSIGLLFQDDTEISEFRVMYSTGLYRGDHFSAGGAVYPVQSADRGRIQPGLYREPCTGRGRQVGRFQLCTHRPWRPGRGADRAEGTASGTAQRGTGRHHRSAAARRRLSAGAGEEL